MTNTELSKTVAALLQAMSPTDLEQTHAAVRGELAGRRPAFDLNEISSNMTPERAQAWAAELIRVNREASNA